MSKKVYFYLNEHQKKELTPLFKEVHKASAKRERSLILGQLKEDDLSAAAFIPKKYAIKMNKIMKEMEAERG